MHYGPASPHAASHEQVINIMTALFLRQRALSTVSHPMVSRSPQGLPGVSPRTPHTPVGPPQQQAPVQGSATRPISSRPPRAPAARTRGAAVSRSLDLDMLLGRGHGYPPAAVCMEDDRDRGACGAPAGSGIM